MRRRRKKSVSRWSARQGTLSSADSKVYVFVKSLALKMEAYTLGQEKEEEEADDEDEVTARRVALIKMKKARELERIAEDDRRKVEAMRIAKEEEYVLPSRSTFVTLPQGESSSTEGAGRDGAAVARGGGADHACAPRRGGQAAGGIARQVGG
jgi:hypothetical protein